MRLNYQIKKGESHYGKRKMYIFYGPESQFGKFRFGGDPEGTIEIYDDHIDFFKKSKGVALAFGAIGSALAGKGKHEITIRKSDVKSCRLDSGTYWLYLADGNLMVVTLEGFSKKDAKNAILTFASGIPTR